jgi:hypothetical protein
MKKETQKKLIKFIKDYIGLEIEVSKNTRKKNTIYIKTNRKEREFTYYRLILTKIFEDVQFNGLNEIYLKIKERHTQNIVSMKL